MAENAHEQAVLAAAKAWWKMTILWRLRMEGEDAVRRDAAEKTLLRAVADWQQAEQAHQQKGQ